MAEPVSDPPVLYLIREFGIPQFQPLHWMSLHGRLLTPHAFITSPGWTLHPDEQKILQVGNVGFLPCVPFSGGHRAAEW